MLVSSLTGQSGLVAQVNGLLSRSDRQSVRIQGPSGSGKSWVGRAVAQAWRDAGGVTFVASGDELFTRRPHFPLLLAVSSETSYAQTRAATKLALEPITAIPLGGKPLREALLHLFERSDSEASARTPFLRQDDREIFMRMQKAASRRRVLLVCENLQWWDEASLQTLALSFSLKAREPFPFLENLAVLSLQTTGDPTEAAGALRTLEETTHWTDFELHLCPATVFGELLRAFGFRSQLPDDLVAHLFAVTGGHLELARRIAEADVKTATPRSWGASTSKSEFLFSLLEQRLERHTSVPEETALVLRAASIIGSSFAEHEINCLLESDSEQLSKLLEPAERLRILVRSGSVRAFSHDLVRSYYLEHAKTRREDLHQRFSECLRLVHSGDYARRAEHLRRAGKRRRAGENLALESLLRMRAGGAPIINALRDDLDQDLFAFVSEMFAAQTDFDTGHYVNAIGRLNGVERLLPDALMAELDILLARCHIKLLTRSDRQQASDILSRWEHLKNAEPEIWGRVMLYQTVASVFLGNEAAARHAERTLYQALAARVQFDPTARRTVNHLRLKSNMLNSVQVARDRLQKAIDFFAGSEDLGTYDPLHQCIGLVNLAANYLVDGEYVDAGAACHRANDLIRRESSVTFSRPDILINNLTLSGYLAGHVGLPEALEASRAVWNSASRNNDTSLLASNLAYYLARQGRYEEVISLLDPVFANLNQRTEPDSYYAYFVGNNLAGALYMTGAVADAQGIWTIVTPFTQQFIGPMAPYIRRRHELQHQIFTLPQRTEHGWDGFLSATSTLQVGPGWKFYGGGFLASELEFWSDE